MKIKINAVIFDFNGTLFFDSEKHEKAWKMLSKAARGTAFSDKEISAYVHGRTNKAILEYLFQKKISKEVLLDFISKKEECYRTACTEDESNMKFVDGAEQLFDFLQKRKIKITVATAAEIGNLKFFRKHFHLDHWFDIEKIVYDNGQINGKPAPDMYLKAAEILGEKPKNCLVFEDSESGLLAAKNAGIGLVIMVDPLGKNSRFCKRPEVAGVVGNFTEVDRTIFD